MLHACEMKVALDADPAHQRGGTTRRSGRTARRSGAPESCSHAREDGQWARGDPNSCRWLLLLLLLLLAGRRHIARLGARSMLKATEQAAGSSGEAAAAASEARPCWQPSGPLRLTGTSKARSTSRGAVSSSSSSRLRRSGTSTGASWHRSMCAGRRLAGACIRWPPVAFSHRRLAHTLQAVVHAASRQAAARRQQQPGNAMQQPIRATQDPTAPRPDAKSQPYRSAAAGTGDPARRARLLGRAPHASWLVVRVGPCELDARQRCSQGCRGARQAIVDRRVGHQARLRSPGK